MVHVAQPAFYDDVATRLRSVDLIVAEGVKGDVPSIGPVSRMYEQFGRGPGPEIVVQDIDYGSLGPPVVNPDLTGAELDDRLREQVPLPDRLLMRAAVPLTGLAVRLLGPQLLMNRYLGLEDLPTVEQERQAEAWTELDDVILHQRDALVVRALAEIYAQHQHDEMHVAGVYGAAHVVGIFRYLSRTLRGRHAAADQRAEGARHAAERAGPVERHQARRLAHAGESLVPPLLRHAVRGGRVRRPAPDHALDRQAGVLPARRGHALMLHP
jgi:hypothetical protein